MNRRTRLAALLAASTLLAAGCGSEAPKIDVGEATAAVTKATGLKLVPEKMPDEARKEGLIGAYSNRDTITTDKQIAFVFVLKNRDTVDQLGDTLKGLTSSLPQVKLIKQENVVVAYGRIGGKDKSASVEAAVKALG